MDSIPFAFCDAVVGTIKDLPRVDVPFRDVKWNKALQDHSANRQCFQLDVAFYNEKWVHFFQNTKFISNTSFTTMLQQVGPKYLRIDRIKCVSSRLIETSKEELHSLLNSLQPFLNFPKLFLLDFPENNLDQVLSSFAKINISEFYSSCKRRCGLEFAKQLMQQDTLVKSIMIQGAEDVLAAAIVECRATGRAVHYQTDRFRGAYRTFLQFVR